MIDLSICRGCEHFCHRFFFIRNKLFPYPKMCEYCFSESLYIDNLNAELNLSNSRKKYQFATYNFDNNMLSGEKFYHVKHDFPKRIPLKTIEFDIQNHIDKYKCHLSNLCPYFVEQELSILSKSKVE